MVRARQPGVALGLAAVELAVKYLRSDAGKAQLRKAPELIRWARQLAARGRPYPDAIDTTATEDGQRAIASPQSAPGRRLNPSERFGRRGLQRRIDALRRGVGLALHGERKTQLEHALDELDRALAVAATLPVLKRQRLQLRIDRQLGDLESALLDAALPGRP